MNPRQIAYRCATIFDGQTSHQDSALLVRDGDVVGITKVGKLPIENNLIELGSGMLAPGFVDLQVNGGGGRMFNNTPDVDTIRVMCDTHLQFGTTSMLPTFISDTPSQTARAINAAISALNQQVAGMIGLHLEGPHLSRARNGAHDPAHIRTMQDADFEQLASLAATLPSLMITVAPESVGMAQMAGLSASGATVSLGHTDASFQTAKAAASNGATCVTHLFNAMSQLGNREPGLVGAALDIGALSAGIIADGFHVDAACMRLALRANKGPGQVFLVTDAMATIGTDMTEFIINDRKISRRGGRLLLPDGTLAGADLDMISAVKFMVREIGLPKVEALRMASLYPARVLGRDNEIGRLGPDTRADFLHLDDGLNILGVWREGVRF